MEVSMDKKQVSISILACYRTGHKPLSELRIAQFTESDTYVHHHVWMRQERLVKPTVCVCACVCALVCVCARGWGWGWEVGWGWGWEVDWGVGGGCVASGGGGGGLGVGGGGGGWFGG